MTTRSKSTSPKRPIRVGDMVRLTHGELLLKAQVVEDRGRIGIGGRRILRVHVLDAPGDDDWFFEVAEDDVKPAA
jgi:hypothetical protein